MSLADLRENEERCRDAALAIQRVLEAEGALYPPIDEAVFQAEVQKVKAMFAGPVAKPAKAAPKIERCVLMVSTPTAPKLSRKAAKSAKAKPSAPEAKAGGMKSRVCVICNKMFLPKAGVQKACSPTCVAEKNRRYALEKYHAKQAAKKKGGAKPAPINLDKPSPAGQPTRLERIRAAAERMDGIPESVRAAVAEARESEVM
jgi:hypothetical protein